MRIPVGKEGETVANAVSTPENYLMACYLGLGYPVDDKVVVEQNTYTADDKMHFDKW